MNRFAILVSSFALLVLASAAQAAGDKKMIIGLGVMHSTADLTNRDALGRNTAEDHSEIGGRLEYWNMMRENYALNFQANLGYFLETDKPGTASPLNTREGKYTQSSWSVRLGGDRVWSPLANTVVFIGPGFEFWTGKRKFENIAGYTSYETDDVKRFSLHGHTGAIMMLGSSWGISGQLGHRIGLATYEERGAKTSWWPSSLDGAMEFVFAFGDK